MKIDSNTDMNGNFRKKIHHLLPSCHMQIHSRKLTSKLQDLSYIGKTAWDNKEFLRIQTYQTQLLSKFENSKQTMTEIIQSKKLQFLACFP